MYACSEIWIMQLSPVEEEAWVVGVVSLWKPELLGRICQSKDRSPNCNSRDRVSRLGALVHRCGKWRAELELCSAVRYLVAGGSTDCCRGLTYTKLPDIVPSYPYPTQD